MICISDHNLIEWETKNESLKYRIYFWKESQVQRTLSSSCLVKIGVPLLNMVLFFHVWSFQILLAKTCFDITQEHSMESWEDMVMSHIQLIKMLNLERDLDKDRKQTKGKVEE